MKCFCQRLEEPHHPVVLPFLLSILPLLRRLELLLTTFVRTALNVWVSASRRSSGDARPHCLLFLTPVVACVRTRMPVFHCERISLTTS